jgi:hypothetical protein
MMDDVLTQNARAFAVRHQLRLAERLGFGIHGTVFVAEGNSKPGKSAIKAHRSTEPYARERAVYERLQEAGVTGILGFHVPQLIRCDDVLQVIEMSIVTRPFVLDFAGAYLDLPPKSQMKSGWNGRRRNGSSLRRDGPWSSRCSRPWRNSTFT